VLVHAAAGGVGSLMVQWASSLGATVIGCVSTEEKAKKAKADGAHHVILYSEKNLVQRVKEITNGVGVPVVYDSVGKDTFQVNKPSAEKYLISKFFYSFFFTISEVHLRCEFLRYIFSILDYYLTECLVFSGFPGLLGVSRNACTVRGIFRSSRAYSCFCLGCEVIIRHQAFSVGLYTDPRGARRGVK
jgi:threonine dehydrogenase-like Zn-dependent dehydrogenase